MKTLFENLSIRAQILGTAFLLLILTAACSGYALITMASIGLELEGITERDIPLTGKITAISEHQLQQAIHFERAFRYGEQLERGHQRAAPLLRSEIDAFSKLDKKVANEIKEAEKLAQQAHDNSHTQAEKKEFQKVYLALRAIEKEHHNFGLHSREAFSLIAKYEIEKAERLATEIVKEEDRLAHKLEALVAEIGQFTLRASDMALKHERDAQWILTIMIATSILVGLSLSVVITNRIWKQIGHEPKQLNEIAQRIAMGDLSDQQSNDTIGIYRSIGQMQQSLRDLISRIQYSGEQMKGSSRDLATLSEQTHNNLDIQHQGTEMVAAAITEMSAAVDEVARHTTEASDAALQAQGLVENSHQRVSETVDQVHSLAEQLSNTTTVIAELESDAEEINGILEAIKSIADQTNLLALNAAIEAARAGDQGRGFAVVADEVRSLAQITQQSAGEIETMINRLQHSANSSVSAMRKGSGQAKQLLTLSDEVAGTLDQVQQSVSQISDMNAQIAAAAEEQRAVAADVSNNVSEISIMAQQNGEGSRNITATSEELARLAEELRASTAQFKLSI